MPKKKSELKTISSLSPMGQFIVNKAIDHYRNDPCDVTLNILKGTLRKSGILSAPVIDKINKEMLALDNIVYFRQK